MCGASLYVSGAGQGLGDDVAVQDYADPCACDQDGVINGVNTGKTGCKQGNHIGIPVVVACLVSSECPSAYTGSTTYNGQVKWRSCNTLENPRLIQGCEDCGLGELSAEGAADCALCEEGSFNGVAGAAVCESCGDELPFSDAGSVDAGACTRGPEGCLQVKIDGCENAYWGDYPTGGVYDVYDGACEEGDQEGRPEGSGKRAKRRTNFALTIF